MPYYLERLVVQLLRIKVALHPGFVQKILNKFENYHLLVSMDSNNILSNVLLCYSEKDRKAIRRKLRSRMPTEFRKARDCAVHSWEALGHLLKFLRETGALLLGMQIQDWLLNLYINRFCYKDYIFVTVRTKLHELYQKCTTPSQIFCKFVQENAFFKKLYFLLRKSKFGSKKLFYEKLLERLGLAFTIEENLDKAGLDRNESRKTELSPGYARRLFNVDKLGRVFQANKKPFTKPYICVWVGTARRLTKGNRGLGVKDVSPGEFFKEAGRLGRGIDFGPESKPIEVARERQSLHRDQSQRAPIQDKQPRLLRRTRGLSQKQSTRPGRLPQTRSGAEKSGEKKENCKAGQEKAG